MVLPLEYRGPGILVVCQVPQYHPSEGDDVQEPSRTCKMSHEQEEPHDSMSIREKVSSTRCPEPAWITHLQFKLLLYWELAALPSVSVCHELVAVREAVPEHCALPVAIVAAARISAKHVDGLDRGTIDDQRTELG